MFIVCRLLTHSKRFLPRWFASARANSFVRNVAMVGGGTAAAQMITIAFSPLITRLYGPEVFGVAGMFMAAVAVIIPLGTLSYSMAIVLPSRDEEARALFKLSVMISLAITTGVTAVICGSHQWLAAAISLDANSAILLVAPIAIMLSTMAQSLQQWLVRKKRFHSVSRVAVIEAAASGATITGVGLVTASVQVLLLLSVLTIAIRTTLLWLDARRTLIDHADQGGSSLRSRYAVSLIEVAYRYRDFPLYRAPTDWLTFFSHSMPPIMLATFLGPAAAGFYVLARRVLAVPSIIIARAFETVFFPSLVEASHQSEKLRPSILKSTAALALIGLAPFGMVVAFGPWLFSFVFGAEWVSAGRYASWLAVWLYFSFINGPSTSAIPILNLQGHFLVFEVVVFFVRTALLAFGAQILVSDIAAVALFSLVGALMNIVMIVWIIIACDARARRVGSETIGAQEP